MLSDSSLQQTYVSIYPKLVAKLREHLCGYTPALPPSLIDSIFSVFPILLFVDAGI